MKNIARPVRVYRVRLASVGAIRILTWHARRWRRAPAAVAAAVLIAVGAWWFWPEARAPKPAIAVLPFADLGGGELRDRLADGITEDIINDLARFREIDVIASNSTSVYAGKPVDVRQIANDLSVKYILEGSIQRQSDRVRIAAQLIDGDTGRHIWSDRWDRPAEDLFAVQSEISETVARRLASYGVIEQAELAIAKRKLPEDLGAYELFLLGLEAQHKQTKEGMDEAIRLLGKAVERDPNLARAWVALGWSHAASIGFGADPEIAKKGEEEAARRALELDPMDAEAHAMLGEVYGFKGEFSRALAAFERALSLNPNNTASLMVYSLWASALGQPERGAEAADRLIRLDPNYPVWVGHGASYAYFMVGRYEDVVRVLERIPNENLRYWELVYRAASYAVLGRTDETKSAVAYALARFPDLSIEGFLSRTPFSDAEQQRLIETMRQAGFPACAADAPAGMPNAVRLPDCGSDKSPT